MKDHNNSTYYVDISRGYGQIAFSNGLWDEMNNTCDTLSVYYTYKTQIKNDIISNPKDKPYYHGVPDHYVDDQVNSIFRENIQYVATLYQLFWEKTHPTQPPNKATGPSPSNGATNQSMSTIISWSDGGGATSYDVYFGTDPTPDSGELKGNQISTSYNPGTLNYYSTPYYWRIDAKNAAGTITGDVWQFTTQGAPTQLPNKVTGPNPSNGATNQSISTIISWSDGGGATSYDVYFGTDPTPDSGELKGNQISTSYNPDLIYGTPYYWRIDAKNSIGTTTGDVWYFTTGSPSFSVNGPVPTDDDPSYLHRNDGDGVFESGEEIHIRPQVCNTGTINATRVDVELYYSGPGSSPVEIESGDERYEDLSAGQCGYQGSGRYYYVYAANKSFTGSVDIGIRVNWDENNQSEPIEIPNAFQLYVHPAPVISITRDHYFGTVCTCESVTSTALVYNTGSSTLNVTGIQTSHADTTVDPSGPFTLEPGQNREIVVTINTCNIGDGTDISRQITVNSNGKLADNTPPSNIFVITGLVSCVKQIHQIPGLMGAESPDISGNWIVYADHRNGNMDIFAYQINTGTEKRITTNTDSQTNPRIHGNLIVWEDWRNDNGAWSNCDIYGYDLSTEQEFVVSNQPVMEELIGVDGNIIAFTRRYEVLYDGDGSLGGYASNLVVYNYLENGQAQEVYSTGWAPGSGYEVRQTVDDDGDFGGGLLVFERYVWTWLDQYERWSMSEGGQWVEIIDFAKGETTPHWAKDYWSSYYSAAEHRFVFQKEYEDEDGNDGDQVWIWDDGSPSRRLTKPGSEEVDHAYNVLATGGNFVVYDKGKEAINRNKLFYWDLAANQAEYPEYLLTDQDSNSLEEARMDGSAVVWRSLDPSDSQWYIYYAFLGRRISVSPSSLDFGDVAVGCSADLSASITNGGNEALIIYSVALNDLLAPPFYIVTDSCSGRIISPGEICMFTIRFSPNAEGSFNDTFDIPSNDSVNDPITITVGGMGAADNDNDCIPNVDDNCPNDPEKSTPGVCGCGVSDIDSDGDGTPDCHDTTAPNAPTVEGTTPTNDITPTWSWTSGGGGNGTYRYKLDDSDLSTGATETTSTNYTPGSALSEGSHTLYVQERDGAGNWSNSGSFTIFIDNTPPVASISRIPSTSSTNLTDATLTVGGEDVVGYKYKVDGGSYSTEKTIGLQISLSGLSEGSHTVYVTGKDMAENWQTEASATTTTWTITIPSTTTSTTSSTTSTTTSSTTTTTTIPETTTSTTTSSTSTSSTTTIPQTTTTTTTVPTFEIILSQGWNLLSFHLDPDDSNVESLFVENPCLSSQNPIISIWKWIGNNWEVYLPGETDGGEAYADSKGFALLFYIDPGEGFWVNAEFPDIICITGSILVDPFYSLDQNWNLIGLKENQMVTVTDFISGYDEVIISIWKWVNPHGKWAVYFPEDPNYCLTWGNPKGFDCLKNIDPGEGFWVNCTEAITLE